LAWGFLALLFLRLGLAPARTFRWLFCVVRAVRQLLFSFFLDRIEPARLFKFSWFSALHLFVVTCSSPRRFQLLELSARLQFFFCLTKWILTPTTSPPLCFSPFLHQLNLVGGREFETSSNFRGLFFSPPVSFLLTPALSPIQLISFTVGLSF